MCRLYQCNKVVRRNGKGNCTFRWYKLYAVFYIFLNGSFYVLRFALCEKDSRNFIIRYIVNRFFMTDGISYIYCPSQPLHREQMPQEVWKSREKRNQSQIHHGRQRQEPPFFWHRNKAFERKYEPGRNKFGNVQTGHESGDFAVCDMLTDCDKFPVRELCNYPFMPLEKGTKAEIS